jgi:hypothetical protein
MTILPYKIFCLNSRLIALSIFIFLLVVLNPLKVFSQDDDNETKVDPILTVSPVIKYSKAIFKNNLAYEGKIFGYVNGESILINEFPALDTFSVLTKQFDSLQFYSEFVENGKSYVLNGFFIKVDSNKIFEFKTSPIMQMSGADLIVENNQLKNLFFDNGMGKTIYGVAITDDVNPDWVKVEALPEAAQYIDVEKLDSSTYQVKFKNKDIFLGSLSEDIKNKWRKGEEIRFPIGIMLTDTIVPDQSATVKYTLVKKKKPKKINN